MVTTAQSADSDVRVRLLRDFTTGYHSRNGGGDRFVTDGDLPIVDVSRTVPPEPVAVLQPDPSTARQIARAPLPVITAVTLIGLVTVLQLVDVLSDATFWQLLSAAEPDERVLILVVVGLFGAFMIWQLVMAWLVLRGGRRSRAVLMVLVILQIIFMAIDYLDGSAVLGLDWTLLTASVQAITLLCLSSESAGAWARRRRGSKPA